MLTVLDRKTNTVTHYAFEDRGPSGKVKPYITFMAEDHEGNLWLATHGAGLLEFDRDHQKFICFLPRDPDNPDSKLERFVGALYADRHGIL